MIVLFGIPVDAFDLILTLAVFGIMTKYIVRGFLYTWRGK